MEIKKSAARAYESPEFNQTLDEILHPGGLELTARLAEVAQIKSDSLVLDIASGRGTTPCFLSQRHDCRVIGIDLSFVSASLAGNKAQKEGVAQKVEFAVADAESLPFSNSSFDIVISECAFSLLPDKNIGAKEIARVLKPGGRLVITDVVLQFPLSEELKMQVLFDSCFSGAETLEGYKEILSRAGLVEEFIEDHSRELQKITYKLVTGYGSISAFWEQFGKGALSCCENSGSDCDAGSIPWKRLFAEGRPGYGLLCFINSKAAQ
jgi:ubiquinone/menaquinone biosynthesis C-methylase UbiE